MIFLSPVKTLIAASLLFALASPAHAASKGYWLLLLTAWHGFEGETFVTDKTYATEKECITKGLHVARHGPFPEDLYNVRRDRVSADCAWVFR
jgi:hypothetical protein